MAGLCITAFSVPAESRTFTAIPGTGITGLGVTADTVPAVVRAGSAVVSAVLSRFLSLALAVPACASAVQNPVNWKNSPTTLDVSNRSFQQTTHAAFPRDVRLMVAPSSSSITSRKSNHSLSRGSKRPAARLDNSHRAKVTARSADLIRRIDDPEGFS